MAWRRDWLEILSVGNNVSQPQRTLRAFPLRALRLKNNLQKRLDGKGDRRRGVEDAEENKKYQLSLLTLLLSCL